MFDHPLDLLAKIRFDEKPVAGALMVSADPRRRLPNAFIQAVAHRGTEVLAA